MAVSTPALASQTLDLMVHSAQESEMTVQYFMDIRVFKK